MISYSTKLDNSIPLDLEINFETTESMNWTVHGRETNNASHLSRKREKNIRASKHCRRTSLAMSQQQLCYGIQMHIKWITWKRTKGSFVAHIISTNSFYTHFPLCLCLFLRRSQFHHLIALILRLHLSPIPSLGHLFSSSSMFICESHKHRHSYYFL